MKRVASIHRKTLDIARHLDTDFFRIGCHVFAVDDDAIASNCDTPATADVVLPLMMTVVMEPDTLLWFYCLGGILSTAKGLYKRFFEGLANFFV